MKKTGTTPGDRKHGKTARTVEWDLRLYIMGQTPRAAKALKNLEQICKERLAGTYRIEIIDLLKSPHLADGDQIIAIPTLVRNLPTPIRKIVGDLSNTDQVLLGLDLRAAGKEQ